MPRAKEPTTSSIGLMSTEMMLIATPLERLLAMPKETAKTIRPTASSRATIGRRISTRGPFALYWFTTIKVAAGAVAVATAPRVRATGTVILSGISKCRIRIETSTRTVADRAWITAITVAFLPIALSWERRNSLPMSKAMKPSATSEMIFRPSTFLREVKPKPSMPSAPRTKGPISRPAIR